MTDDVVTVLLDMRKVIHNATSAPGERYPINDIPTWGELDARIAKLLEVRSDG